MKTFLICLALWLPFGTLVPAIAQETGEGKARLPRPRVLGTEDRLTRDTATGELRTTGAAVGEATPATAPAIRTRVTMVEVGCTIMAPDGTRVRGLGSKDFRIWENDAEQTIAAFDAAVTPANVVLLFDASPSIYRELGEMRDVSQSLSRSLGPGDEVAVAAFANRTLLLLPFSRDRELLSAALASSVLSRVADSSQSFIYQAVYLAARELFSGRSGRKAIVLVTDGQDSGLGLSWDPRSMQPRPQTPSALAFEDVARALGAEGIELYIISTGSRPKEMTEAWLRAAHGQSLLTSEARRLEIPLYTLYLAELVRQVGGGLYFLREMSSLAEVYHRIALELGAQYTLGYYPSAGIAQPGWRTLRVALYPEALAALPGARLAFRDTYYVPATP